MQNDGVRVDRDIAPEARSTNTWNQLPGMAIIKPGNLINTNPRGWALSLCLAPARPGLFKRERGAHGNSGKGLEVPVWPGCQALALENFVLFVEHCNCFCTDFNPPLLLTHYSSNTLLFLLSSEVA